MNEILYVITPIFNPMQFKSRIRLYNEFAPYIEFSGAQLFTVEVAFNDHPFEVTAEGNPFNLQLKTTDVMWHKERAINLGIQRLLQVQPNAKYIAWIDADVRFSDPEWVKNTILALQHYNIIQLFSQASFLKSNNEQLWITDSMMKKFITGKGYSQKPPIPLTYISGGHPGLAWAAKRETLEGLGGLIDFCIAGCYDEDTQVCTRRGFIPFSELTMEDKVLTRSKDEKVEWGDVTKLYKYPFKGNMYKIKSSSLDLLVTPNHNMFYRKIYSDDTYFEKIEDTKADRRIPKVSSWEVPEPVDFQLYGASSIENFVAFMGIWLAEGWIYLVTDKPSGSPHYRIGIAQNKEVNLLKIKELLDDTFPNISWVPSSKKGKLSGYIGTNKELFNYLLQFGKVYDKFIPETIKSLPKKYLDVFMEWFILGDGSVEEKNNPKHKSTTRLYTSSKKLRDDLLELSIKIGSWASYGERVGQLSIPLEDGRQIQSSKEYPSYSINLHKSKNFILKTKAISEEFYDGFVYCCETPHHTLLVKRNNKMVWCGNSGDTHMANAFKGDVDLFFKPGMSPGFRKELVLWKGRADKYVNGNIGYIDGICTHYWHGASNKRGYIKRWEIMLFHQFDPQVDIYYALNGLYKFSGNKSDMVRDLAKTLNERDEDAKS